MTQAARTSAPRRQPSFAAPKKTPQKVRAWQMVQQSFEVRTNEGIVRTNGLTLPGRACISMRSLGSVLPKKERRSNQPMWNYPGCILAPKAGRKNSAEREYQVIGELYGYMRQQWHITTGLKNETIKMTRAVIEARAVAHLLLEKGHCTLSEHNEIIARLLALEAMFTDPDFRDDYKIKAGDLFMQVGVEPDPDPRKNAPHSLTTFAGARHLEKRKQQTLIMSYYLNPRFLQIRGVVKQYEDQLNEVKTKLGERGTLRMSYRAYKRRADRDSRNQLIGDLGFLEQKLFNHATTLPFAPQARAARMACSAMREQINAKTDVDFTKTDALFDEMVFRVSLLRLIVRVERDIILPLTVLEIREPAAEESEQRRQIFAATQEDIRKLFELIQAESKKSLARLKELSVWIAKLDYCRRNKFEDHKIVREDAKRFVEYLVLASLPEA